MKIDQPKIDRFIALLLIIGGGAGLGLAIVLWLQASLGSLFALLLLAMFGASAWVGIGLWREQPRYHVWAQLMFALQIPIVSCSAFTYKFFTAMTLDLSFERAAETKLHIDWELGSKFSFSVPSDTPDLIIGVNLLALAAFTYFVLVPRKSTNIRGNAQLVSPASQTAE